jgi:hypothetical protein
VEKVNRLKIAEKERDNLSGSKLEAEAFIEKEKDIRRKKNLLYQTLESRVNVTIAELQGKQEKAAEKLGTERGKLGDTEKRLAVIQGEYEKVKSEHDKVQAELEKSSMVRFLLYDCGSFAYVRLLAFRFETHQCDVFSQQYDAFERNDVKLQEDMKHAKALIKKQQVCVAGLRLS